MKPEIRELEYRRYLGLDTRADETLVPLSHQIKAKNVILQKGVYLSKKGTERWGTLDHSALLGVVHQIEFFDIGAIEYVILHKGTGLYYGTKFDTSFTQIQDLSSVDVVAVDDESEMAAIGYAVSGNGKFSYKILFKQQAACKILEFNDGVWIGRSPGIDNTGITFALSDTGSGNAQAGQYRVRVTARRNKNGVRVNESAPVGKSGTTDDKFYQEITVPAGGGTIQITITDSSPDIQTTDYGVQITRVLSIVDGTDWSQNENDPTIFYEAIEILSGGANTIPTDTNDLAVVAPNMIGHIPIPGHLISVVAGNLTFFTGVGDFKNRIFHSGTSGFYYHSELYDPFTFHSGGDDDGQLIIGLGAVQDHLLVVKEAKTGIIANRSLTNVVTWRDFRLGGKHRNCFSNISEDEVVILNQDGIFRIFNGIRYDREATMMNETYGYSENIRTLSETIDPSTLSFVYEGERLHIIYGPVTKRDVLVFHPRDNWGWTLWEDVDMNVTFKADNGSLWVFERGGQLFLQNPDEDVYTDDGDDYEWEVEFALMTSQITKKNKALVKLVGVDGEFDSQLVGRFNLDFGRIITPFLSVLPDPTDPANASIKWYQVLGGDEQIIGNFIKLSLRGSGKATVRGIYWGYIDKSSGNLGWVQPVYTASDYILANYITLDGQTQTRNDALMVENDAGDQSRVDATLIEYDRTGV